MALWLAGTGRANRLESQIGWRDSAPLCPAGHLPHLGGDWRFRRLALSCSVRDWRNRRCQPISPLAGEMSGRTEGG
ncbi:MAG: hypothetical protein EOS55_05430 [Mesorhizobium sp.]|nr:MAG: hypothetical protein EOS55_05430 [Mesorhizobium sp.]